MVLRKPGKEPKDYLTSRGYRPIVLLLTIRKVVEVVVA